MIGIIPAGGQAIRMGKLPKMLLPLGDDTLLSILLRRMQLARPRKLIIAATNGNKKLLRAYRDRATLFDAVTPTMTHAVILARDETHMDERTIFGMPDTWWPNEDVFQRLNNALAECDVAVGVWSIRPDQRGQGGQCHLAPPAFRVRHVIDKDPNCDYAWIWGALAWRPIFWDFLTSDMPHVGYALQPAIDAGLDVRAECFKGSYYDCGTPTGYYACVKAFLEQEKS